MGRVLGSTRRVPWRAESVRTAACRLAERSPPRSGSPYEVAAAGLRPDVVHFHSVQHHLTATAVDACLERGVPVVWTLHDYRTVCPASALLRAGEVCERCAGGHFWHGIAGRCKSDELSRSLAAVVESYVTCLRGTMKNVDCYIAPSRLSGTQGNADGAVGTSDRGRPEPRDCVWRCACRRTRGAEVLYVGRLSVEKGVETLIRAVALTRRRAPQGCWRWAGFGEPAGVGPSDRCGCPFDGWLDAESVQGLMRRARVLCVPSIWYENCPGVVLEAMAVGLPVVASDLGGLTELLDGGRAGWLAPAGDPAAWSEVLRQALSQPERGRELAEAALARVRSRHDPEGFLDAIEAVYESLVDSRNATRVSTSDRHRPHGGRNQGLER